MGGVKEGEGWGGGLGGLTEDWNDWWVGGQHPLTVVLHVLEGGHELLQPVEDLHGLGGHQGPGGLQPLHAREVQAPNNRKGREEVPRVTAELGGPHERLQDRGPPAEILLSAHLGGDPKALELKTLYEEVQVWEELGVLCKDVVDVLDWLDVPEQLKVPQVQLGGHVGRLEREKDALLRWTRRRQTAQVPVRLELREHGGLQLVSLAFKPGPLDSLTKLEQPAQQGNIVIKIWPVVLHPPPHNGNHPIKARMSQFLKVETGAKGRRQTFSEWASATAQSTPHPPRWHWPGAE